MWRETLCIFISTPVASCLPTSHVPRSVSCVPQLLTAKKVRLSSRMLRAKRRLFTDLGIFSHFTNHEQGILHFGPVVKDGIVAHAA